ncbi:MAG: GNAT family N-acetyltransferase, partial [Pseudomonadota bacterium]
MEFKVPTLHTERLILRPLAADDFASFEAFLASERSEKMGGPYDARSAWGIFCHEVALWQLYGFGGLSIDLSATGDNVGIVEINYGPIFPEPELGWQLYEQHEGNGYATEAARALRDWAFRERKLKTLVSYIDPTNTR